MAPFIEQIGDALAKRQNYIDCGRYPYDRACQNNAPTWYLYGRWIFTVVLIVVVIAIFFLWACINSRRRRRRGATPMYGTGWMAPAQHGAPHPSDPPPPAYGAPPSQGYPMGNQPPADGYNGQYGGVEQPKPVYGGQVPEYSPPSGPPPNR